MLIDWIAQTLLLLGAGLGVLAGIGVHRLPDFFTRMHAASIIDTLAAGLFFLGLMLHYGLSLDTVKVMLVFFCLLFTSPTASHALAKTALHAGLQPWLAAEQEIQQESQS